MTTLTPVASWDNVNQHETTTLVLGGPGGPMNQQAQALLNRTQFLLGLGSYVQPYTGSVSRQIQARVLDQVFLTDFLSPAQIADIRAGTLGIDCSAALNYAMAACESNNQGLARELILPAGVIRIDSSLVLKKIYGGIRGAGEFATKIALFGANVDGIKFDGQLYWRGSMRDFSIEGDSSTGYALNLSGITGQVYESEFSNMYLKSGKTAFYAPGGAVSEFFNNTIRKVSAFSFNGHGFHVANGPGNIYESCYAVEVPAGKAGYRMAGLITMIGCNGVNEGDVWAAFGSKPDGTDGFQDDFQYIDLPVITMIGCNVERFGSRTVNGIGVRVCNSYRTFDIIGGAFQRADDFAGEGRPTLAGANSYKAMISAYGAPVAPGNPIRFGAGAVYLRDAIDGTGTNTPSQAYFYFEFGGHLEDTSGAASARSINSYRVNNDGLSYPTARRRLLDDIYGGYAQNDRALSPRRLSIQTVRYNTVATSAALAPVGTNQAIDVTGRTKVIVTPASGGTSISTATFTSTAGDPATDYGRNGDLIIEAGNANLTIVHAASGANTFKLTGGVNLGLAAGQVVRFCRSETGGNWWQV